MPYLKQEDKKRYEYEIKYIVDGLVERHEDHYDVAGDLNYVITAIIVEFFRRVKVRYSLINMFTGALECCKLELYRRLAAPYEDEKIKENGDVYDD